MLGSGWVDPIARCGTVTFQGMGITETNLGYQPIWNLRHDYSQMYNSPTDNTRLVSTGPLYYDGSDFPYDDFTLTWQTLVRPVSILADDAGESRTVAPG